MESRYSIRRVFAVPLAILFLLLFALMPLVWLCPALPGERLIVTILFLVAGYMTLEALSREIIVGKDLLIIRKLFRRKEFEWREITHLGFLALGAKVYLLLTTTKGYYSISNTYEQFSDLGKNIQDRLGADRLEEGIPDFTINSFSNNKPVYSAWFAVLVFSAVFIWRFNSIFHVF